MDRQILQNLKNGWRNCNNASSEFLSNVPADKINDKPFTPRFTNFAYEFACIIRTRLAYIEALPKPPEFGRVFLL